MDLKVHINDIHGSQMAAKINGNFTLDNHEFHFTAIAFGRIGGQNVGAKLSKITETELIDKIPKTRTCSCAKALEEAEF